MIPLHVTVPAALSHVRFNLPAAVLALAAVAYVAIVSPTYGRRRYARLKDERERDPAALGRFYRRKLLQQGLWAAAVVAAVAVSPGLGWAGVGLAWPSGHGVGSAVQSSAEIVALVVVSGLLFRRWALSGHPIPGQRLFAAMLPRTASDRWWALVVAVGAGISEEMLCRGLLIAAGIGIFGMSPLWAAVAAAAVFGTGHAYQGPIGIVITGVAAVLFTWLYFSTGSLLLGMAVHAVIDIRGLVIVPEPALAPASGGPGPG